MESSEQIEKFQGFVESTYSKDLYLDNILILCLKKWLLLFLSSLFLKSSSKTKAKYEEFFKVDADCG